MGVTVARGNVATCKAHARTTGKTCTQPAIPGGAVCVYHGGKAPQVQAAANLRLLELAEPALTALLEIVNDRGATSVGARLSAAKDILDRCGLVAVQKVETTNVDDKDSAAQLIQRFKDKTRREAEAAERRNKD